MQFSKRLIALGATTAIIISACSGSSATTAPTTAASVAPSVAPSVAASVAPSVAPSVAASASTAPASVAPSQNTNWVACVAFDTGGLGDKGFNDLAKKGLDEAQAAGFTTHYSEAKGSTDYAANIQRLIDQGCQSIITVGFNQAQATVDAVKKNPKIDFGQVDTTWDTTNNGPTPANFTGLDFQIDQAAMLAATSSAAGARPARWAPTVASSSRA